LSPDQQRQRDADGVSGSALVSRPAPAGLAHYYRARWVQKRSSERERRQLAENLAQQVGIRAEYLDRLPHAFSGGQRQRIAIARALSSDPDIIVLDEPTSALDISVQAQILNLLVKLQQQRNLTYVLISHNVSVVRHMSDRVAVMYLGQIVELGPARQVLNQPRHPYTQLLLDSVPRTGEPLDDSLALRKTELPGNRHLPAGCYFRDRCPLATEGCQVPQSLQPAADGRACVAGVKSPDANCSFSGLFTRLCLCGTACAAAGFAKPLPHTGHGNCVTLPAPYTADLVFRSKYEGSDSARATLNPEAEKAFRDETKPITDFERGISQMIWRYKYTGDAKTRDCILSGFKQWADANALTSAHTNHTGRSMRKWALATLATGWVELKFMPGSPLKRMQILNAG
jgi:oligopeptide/dipeptide ABC transporter ATP-binding protein